MLHEDDIARLRHMLDAGREAQQFIKGRTRTDLDVDILLRFGLIYAIQIIGEAAGHVSPAARAALPQIPWPQVVSMRHRLVHGYVEVDLNRLWDTATGDIPMLLPMLEAALRAEGITVR
jgi:uncharacterized protein with HEPN domain